jgi:WD40 repeat protein
MADVFISYSRKDKAFVQRLHSALAKLERDVWVDWEDIPLTANWWKEICTGIESADNFLFIITPESARSKVCFDEIQHAVSHNKRMIPLLLHDLTEAADQQRLHPAVNVHNWIFFKDDQEFDQAFESLITSIDTDLVHVKAHTRLLIRALEWEKKEHDASLLLRGSDLAEAEAWLSVGYSKVPEPTDLHSQFIFASRKAETRRQRTLLAGVSIALVVALILAAVALWQSQVAETRRILADNNAATATFAQGLAEDNEETAIANAMTATVAQGLAEDNEATAVFERDRADQQYRLAFSRQLAAQSLNLLPKQFALGLLLSLEAYKVEDTFEARQGLFMVVTYLPELRYILRDHQAGRAVTVIAVSPDGTRLASGDDEGEIIVWDVATGQRIGSRTGLLLTSVESLTFTEDGQQVMAIDGSGDIHFWDVVTGALTHWPRPNAFDVVVASDFSADLKTAAIDNTESDRITLYDLSNPENPAEVIGEISGNGSLRFVLSFGYSPDGTTIATPDILGERVDLWDVETLSLRTSIELVSPAGGELAFSPDGKILAVYDARFELGNNGNVIVFFDGYTGEEIRVAITGLEVFPTEMAFSPNNQLLAVGDDSGAINLYAVEDGQPVVAPLAGGHSLEITSLAFTPDSSTLISASQDGTIVVWDLSGRASIGQRMRTSDGVSIGFQGLAYSPDGTLLAAAAIDHIYLFDAQNRQELAILDPQNDQVIALAFSPDSQLLASAHISGTVKLWDVKSALNADGPYTTAVDLNAHEGIVDAVAFSLDGRLLASGGDDGRTLLWNVQSQRVAGELPIEFRERALFNVLSLAFGPDNLLAVGNSASDLRLWDVQQPDSPQEVVTLGEHGSGVSSVTFSQDGRKLASGSGDGVMRVWEVNDILDGTIPPAQTFVGHTDIVNSVAFSPDAQTLASASSDGSVIIWDVLTAQPLGIPFRVRHGIDLAYKVAFSGDNGTLATAYSNGLVFWDMKVDTWLQNICQRANLNFSLSEWARYLPDQPYEVICPQSAAQLDTLINDADAAWLAGDTARAESLFQLVTDWALQTKDDVYAGRVCFYGSLDGFASLVMPACDHAVELAPTLGLRHDRRGLARALTGDFAGAIQDFQFSYTWIEARDAMYAPVFGEGALIELRGRSREEWIAELEAGNNPFDEETLQMLREE